MSGSDQPQRQVVRLHGRTHPEGGSDPIPGFSRQIRFATLKTFGAQSVTGTVYIDMEDGVSGIYETSDDTIFQNAQNLSIGGSPWGIKCLANGTYIVKENYFVSGGTAGATVTTYHTISGGDTISEYQAGRTGALVGDTWDRGRPGLIHTSFEEWMDATDGSPAPLYVNPYVELGSGAAVSVDVETMAIYLGLFAAGAI